MRIFSQVFGIKRENKITIYEGQESRWTKQAADLDPGNQQLVYSVKEGCTT